MQKMLNKIFNKNSSAYFIGFFTIVIFGFILILNFVNNQLKDKIQTAKNQEITSILDKNMPCGDYKKSIIDNQSFYYCKNSNIIALNDKSNGYIDKIEYFALFNIQTRFITYLEVINHKETPGLGDNVSNKNWLATIYNKALNKLYIKLDNGVIDSFTAASVTPRKFLIQLRANTEWLNKNKNLIKQTVLNQDNL
jgi:Na+-translocating ferredoxin:NAD+ oxidoreductase RnfG subunit